MIYIVEITSDDKFTHRYGSIHYSNVNITIINFTDAIVNT